VLLTFGTPSAAHLQKLRTDATARALTYSEIGATSDEVMPPEYRHDELVVLVVAPFGPLRTIAPCRIVSVVDDETRFGFAYGTLPEHPEQGEEAFVCERSPAGGVTFRVRAFSRPHDPLARIGAPISRWVQTRTTRGYLNAMRDFVSDS
jgi:uncharacterized protein (UPF0548 family)